MEDEEAMNNWRALRHYFQKTGRAIQVVVGHSADAACAARTLSALLTQSLVLHDVHAVDRYAELRRVVARNTDVAAGEKDLYVLLGCGAAADLTDIFIPAATHAVHVIDTHRPIHLDTLRSPLFVVWDAAAVEAEVSRFMAHHNRKRRRARDHASSDDDDSESSSDDDEGGGALVDWQDGAVPAALERDYYSAAWTGKAAAMEMFDMAVLLGQSHPSYIWHAAVGAADLLRRRAITEDAYEVEHHKLAHAVAEDWKSRKTLLGDAPRNVNASRTGDIVWHLDRDVDEGLFLLRHGSLWAALWHSTDVATTRRLHHVDEGTDQLRSMLADVGVSAADARKPWAEMALERRKEVLTGLRARVKATRRAVVVRVERMKTPVSPFDACTLFDAELARVPPPAADDDGKLEDFRRAQFWTANDVIHAAPNTKLFNSALVEATSLAAAIEGATGALMQRDAIVTIKTALHYGMLDKQRGKKAYEDFWFPARLRLLADHLVCALSEEKRMRRLPLILCCPRPGSDECIAMASAVDATSALNVERSIAAGAKALSEVGGAADHIEGGCAVFSDINKASMYVETVHLRLGPRLSK
jgi:cell division control protein 45